MHDFDRPRLTATRLRPLVAGLLLVILGACAAPAPTAQPTPAATPPASPAGPTDPNLHAFPELEARLPTHIGRHELVKMSVASVAEDQRPITQDILRRLDRTADDIQLAIATGGDEIQISAFRVVGSAGVDIIVAFQAVEEVHPDSNAVYGTATIAGRRLVTRTTQTQTTYLYPAEDIMFVLAGREALIEEALEQLPG
jgi:N-acetylmuramic acid 6-phosphate (MurNAc-6-P) etherase